MFIPDPNAPVEPVMTPEIEARGWGYLAPPENTEGAPPDVPQHLLDWKAEREWQKKRQPKPEPKRKSA